MCGSLGEFLCPTAITGMRYGPGRAIHINRAHFIGPPSVRSADINATSLQCVIASLNMFEYDLKEQCTVLLFDAYF